MVAQLLNMNPGMTQQQAIEAVMRMPPGEMTGESTSGVGASRPFTGNVQPRQVPPNTPGTPGTFGSNGRFQPQPSTPSTGLSPAQMCQMLGGVWDGTVCK